MGYACPVCDTPQRDGEHLAHHLAFTAMLHGGSHEDWLEEQVPDWSGCTPAELADEVRSHATETEYHEVFEDTTNTRGPGRPDLADVNGLSAVGRGRRRASGRDSLDQRRFGDDETRAVLEKARALTREMMDETDANETETGDYDGESAEVSDNDAVEDGHPIEGTDNTHDC